MSMYASEHNGIDVWNALTDDFVLAPTTDALKII